MKPPEYLGPYRVGEMLGKGGMGAVYQAQHVKSGDLVAVKLIALQISDEMRFRRRFDIEIKTLQRLSHPNIVKLIGFGEEKDLLFYSMEYVEGQSLQERIRELKKLPWGQVLDIAIQICAALKHAHDIGVIHRDLKPANLLVKEDSTIKLVDFGISKIFGYNLTAAGSIMGTADYMAPEQATEGVATARTDLYALGCVIYAMTCGRPPFRGKNVTEVIESLKHKDPVPLDLIDPDLPDDLVQLVNELLEKDPANRPPTALAVMNRLKAMRSGLQKMGTLVDRPSDGAKPFSESPTVDTKVSGDDNDRTGKTTSGKTPASKTVAAVDRTRPDDTIEFQSDESGTAATQVNPSAKTVGLEQDAGQTIQATSAPGTDVTNRSVHSVNVSLGRGRTADQPSSDTSVGTSAKTHFQTVSDDEVRRGFFEDSAGDDQHSSMRTFSIIAIVIVLAVGIFVLIAQLRGPSPEDLIATIESFSAEQTFERKNELERFIKLFPDHPQADSFRDQLTAYQVDATVRRLRLRAKLRTDDGPLYETAFLQAMNLRDSDPEAAKEQLQQWIDVFHDSSMTSEDAQLELQRLAAFEIERLASNGASTADDPKLTELLQRIEDAKSLPVDERRRLLEGIQTLYEGQDWADAALKRAQALLDEG
ncbi:serine/threonine-protein kinase [Roseiconus lacunae]|uniref:Serine/threonine-protein kinase n=1 Tax=Roseiconus lacunae TaxID=2605694 RepID=A0ABT7PG78_9BACT|nr:serine/threonine-protein kinase [Roseiconus lacunae]MDM4015487.1 serine/threonine-protein kinase [Roseiconus lacunae]